MKKEKYNVAVVGATGAVGNEMVCHSGGEKLSSGSIETSCLHTGAQAQRWSLRESLIRWRC